MNWKVPRVSSKKYPKEYAFSCFDNAVRFAYYFSKNEGNKSWFVVGGHNKYGVHYGYMSVDSNGVEEVFDFDSSFLNGVEARLAVGLALEMRNNLVDAGHTRISPCVDQPERQWGRSVRFNPDAEVALAPAIVQGRVSPNV